MRFFLRHLNNCILNINLFETVLLAIFSISIVVQLYYIFFIFSKLAFCKKDKINLPLIAKKGISVIVAAHNEEKNLKQFLPSLFNQDYPDYEIVIVNDRSSDGTYDYLREMQEVYPNLKVVKVERKPEHINGKKFALTMGIKAAKNECLLFTDADCVPAHERWISTMSEQFTDKTSIVLGYSQYLKAKGFLNNFIRFETFYTALQYLSLALVGKPYMGVGRNLAYKKSLFFEQNGFFKHLVITGGDDDLFVNNAATAENTVVVLGKESQTLSVPKTTWQTWFKQKKRHLSVGKFYKTEDKVRLGLLSISHLLCWFSALLIAYFCYCETQIILAGLIGGFMLLRWVALWVVMHRAKRNLGDELSLIFLPLLDFFYTIYYLVIGFASMSSRKVKWA